MSITSRRILVVDDEPSMCDFLQVFLVKEGHSVMTVLTAREALTTLESGHFDLVLTDLYMPEMRGDELAQAIKGAHAAVYIILFSGLPPKLRPEPIDLMVRKPASVQELRDAIAACP